MSKKKVTAYLDPDLHKRLMQLVFKRMKKDEKFRGVITDIVVEAIEEYLQKLNG